MVNFGKTVGLSAAFSKIHNTASPLILPPHLAVEPVKIPVIQTGPMAAFNNAFSDTQWQFDPVGFKTFCESKKHMHMLPKDWKEGEEGALSARQFEDCIAILGDDPKTMFDPEIRRFTFGAFLWSKGSGKDFVCSLIQTYMTHVLLCMSNPQKFFGFAPGEPCDILNVGAKGDQAERVYFSKLKARTLDWPWMLERYNVVEEGKRFSYLGKNYPTCTVGKRSIEWSDKIVRAYSENSGNPQSIEGYNIIFYIADEISGWTSEKGRELADEIMGILRTSQMSRSTSTLSGIGMAISYPRQDDDIMFDFEKEAQQPNTKTFFSRGYWWDIRPKRQQSGKTFKFNAGTEESPEWFDIPSELDETFFKQHPEQAKCMFLLRPPPVGGVFFEFYDKVGSVKSDRTPLFKTASSLINAVDGHGKKIQYIRKSIIGLNRQPDPSADYVVWVDAGESTCDAALSIGHKEQATIIESGIARETTIVVLDDSIIWEPDPKNRIIVDIGSMTQAILDMKKYISLRVAWWDQWNSGTGMFDLRNAGISCDKHNLSGEDYDFFKGLVYTNRFIGPNCPEVDKGIGQLKHLTRTRTGNVTPGSSLHKKDVADTWCGIATLLLGSLVQHNLRSGKAPAAISISTGSHGSTSGITGIGAAQRAASNPFSPGGTNTSGRVADHSDMFKILNRGIGGGSGAQMRMPVGTRTPRTSTAPNTAYRFPRGVKL